MESNKNNQKQRINRYLETWETNNISKFVIILTVFTKSASLTEGVTIFLYFWWTEATVIRDRIISYLVANLLNNAVADPRLLWTIILYEWQRGYTLFSDWYQPDFSENSQI